MKRRKLLIQTLVVLMVSVAVSCQVGPESLKIEGTIEDGNGEMIYLNELKVSGTKTIDSVKISRKGRFEFKVNTTNHKFYILATSPKSFITLQGDSAETISIKANYADFATNYSVTGSESSELIRQLNTNLQSTKFKLDSIAELASRTKDQQQLQEYSDKFQKTIDKQTEFSTQFLTDNPFSLAAVVALYQRYDNGAYVVQDLQKMKTVASALSVMYPESKHSKALLENTLQIMRNEKNNKLSQMIEQFGSNSPDIALPDSDGKEVKLSDLNAKYTLVQFWSAKDKTSRILNPVLVENYKNYKNKGFEIYQVSVDTDRVAWLTAIKMDKLTWTNVGDMKGSFSAVTSYNIQTIPYNYLLDPKGEIIAKNVRGPELANMLHKLLD